MIKPYARNYIYNKFWKDFLPCLDFLDEMVCVSNHTKYSIKNFFPNVNKPINVFYTPSKYAKACQDLEPIVKDKYILLLGLNRSEKIVIER